jgi:hypothetical protein
MNRLGTFETTDAQIGHTLQSNALRSVRYRTIGYPMVYKAFTGKMKDIIVSEASEPRSQNCGR